MLKRLLSWRRTQAPDPAAGPAGSWYFFGAEKAGVRVDQNSALALSAVYACVSIIAKSLAALPFRVYETDGDTRELQQENHVDQLIHRAPNPEITANIFWRTLLGHVLTWGNGYAEIERGRSGEPTALWILTPDRVEPKRDDRGRLYYEVRNSTGTAQELSPRFVLHLRGLSFDGLKGYAPVDMARETLSTSLAAEQYAGSFFGNGAMPASVITSNGTTTISPEAVKKLLASFRRKHQGPGNRHKVEYLDPGMDIKSISIPPEQAQFLESRRFQVEEIARWYGVPLHKIGHLEKATNNNIEEQGLDFTVDTLQPWGDVLVQEVNAKLLPPTQYSKFNYKARMQTDIKARGEFYRQMFNSGAYSPNDILRLEDENPVPGGDTRFIQVNMMPLEQAAKMTAPSRPQPTASAAWPVLLDTCTRMARKEAKALEAVSGDMDKTLDFYHRHQTRLLDAVKPALQTAAAITHTTAAQLYETAESVIERHIQHAYETGTPIKPASLAEALMEAACSTN